MSGIGSDRWIEQFASAVAPVDAGDVGITVRHQIDGGPSWLIRAAGGRVTVEPADASTPATLTFTWQRDDAEAVAAGACSALAPFQAGRLRVDGDLRRLVEVADLFARLPTPVG